MAESVQRRNVVQRFVGWLARVTAVEPGKPDDGVTAPVVLYETAPADKRWSELQSELGDALEAWRKNPLARRIVGLITSYVVGDGIELRSSYGPFSKWLPRFLMHPENNVQMRQGDWCDELTRSGELFLILFPTVDGLHYVRALPASQIEYITWQPGDYEAELSYHQVPDSPGEDGQVWWSPRAPQASVRGADGGLPPVMLHFAVNRPVGATRGESDLAPILPWLRRYSGWLQDRVRLNAAVRAFLWIVKVPSHLIKEKEKQYRTPPEPGSVLFVDRESESWEAVTPDLKATDAKEDGRAIRSMIVAGGPGTGLVDIGEAETSNMATAKEMSEQRRRFLRRRQAYFGYVLMSLAVTAWNRAQSQGLVRGKPVSLADVVVDAPDVSVADNESLATAAAEITRSLAELKGMVGPSDALQRLTLRLFLKFAGETVEDADFDEIVAAEATDLGSGLNGLGERGSGGVGEPGNGRMMVGGDRLAVNGLAEEDDAYGDVRGGLEERATAGVGEGLAAQADGLRRPAGEDVDDWTAWAAGVGAALSVHEARLLEALEEALTASTADGRRRALADAEALGVDVPEDLDEAGLQRWIADTAASILAQVNETSAMQVGELVQREAEKPEEERDWTAVWVAALALFGLSRAGLIGVTETSRGLNEGWLSLWRELANVQMETEPPRHPRCRCWLRIQRRPGGGWQVLWMTTLDERVCPLCGPLHGMEVGGTR